MKKLLFKLTLTILALLINLSLIQAQADTSYLKNIRNDLRIKWPNNRTINLVFHGHSVPSGYYTGGVVYKFGAYPHYALEKIKGEYPYAVLNSITTSIGGENSITGSKRFEYDVLSHHPDVLFIDYALNDRKFDFAEVKAAWEQMIDSALAYRFTTRDGVVRSTKIYLMTPTPDTSEDILDDNSALAKHAAQIRQLAKDYNIGLVDSYAIFKRIASKESLDPYMAQANHINDKGHKIVGDSIAALFLKTDPFVDDLYYIKGKLTNKLLTVTDSSELSQAHIYVWDSLGTKNQKFWVTSTANGYEINPYYNNFSLAINGDSVQNGARLIQRDSSGVAAERFNIVKTDNQHYFIINKNSGRYLASAGQLDYNGLRVIQWDNFSNDNFKWEFIPVTEPEPPVNSIKEKTEASLGIKAYPNPSNGRLTITKASTSDIRLAIADLSGKTLLKYNLTNPVSELELSDKLKKGVYILQFTNGRLNDEQQFVIK